MSDKLLDEKTEKFFAEQILIEISEYIGTHKYIKVMKRPVKIPDTFGGYREIWIKPKILRIYTRPDYILIENNNMIKDENYKLIFDVKLGYRSYSIHLVVGINKRDEIDIIDAEIIGGRIR